MNQVLDYLTKYHAVPNVNEMITHFAEHFGVDIDQGEPGSGLFLFNYNMLSVKWSLPLTHQCRGLIMHNADGVWSIVSWPYDKFFNFGEPYCPLHDEVFIPNRFNFGLVTKEDGTFINLYCHKGTWRISTRGKINTSPVHRGNVTFEQLFWQTIERLTQWSKEQFCSQLNPKIAYLYELCTETNRVVSLYSQPSAYLIGAREHEYYRLLTHSELDAIAAKSRVLRPNMLVCSQFENMAAVKKYVEDESLVQRMGEPLYKEGFVVYDSSRPVAKLKNSKYLVLHSVMSGGDPNYIFKSLMRSYFSGTIDDVYEALPEHQKKCVEIIKARVSELITAGHRVATLLNEQAPQCDDPKEERKQYALLVQKFGKEHFGDFAKCANPYFFMNMASITAGLLGDFTSHIANKWEDQLDYWKSIAKFDQ